MELKSMLIVDDSATSRLIIKRCFDMAGYESIDMIEAEDGISGLAEVADRQFDLIVTDVNMPKMDGRTFVKKLNVAGITQSTPVMVITSQSGEATSQSLIDAGAAIVVAKPISPAKIAQALEHVARIRGSRQ